MRVRDSDRTFYTFAEAARRLGISRQAVSVLARRGRLACIKQTNRYYVTGYSLTDYEQRRAKRLRWKEAQGAE